MIGLSANRSTNIFFNKDAYDPSLDYLKGVCIIFVILNHCMPENMMRNTGFFFWGSSAVPIFLMIQVFHTYKNTQKAAEINFGKIWHRILKPFLIIEAVTISIYIIITAFSNHGHFDTYHYIMSIIKWGGNGPGSYYPWIYVQFAIILPLIKFIFKKNNIFLCVCLIIISQLTETFFAYIEVSERVYRLLFTRYLYIIYLGYILADKGFKINLPNTILAFCCLLFTIWLVYYDTNLNLYFVQIPNSVCHWFCYIYISYLLFPIIEYSYIIIGNFCHIKAFIIKAGRYSYEIFLLQMVYFGLIHESLMSIIKTYTNNIYYTMLLLLLPLFFNIFIVFLYKQIIEPKFCK